MDTQRVKWGKGQGIRIPKLFMQELDLQINDRLSMEIRGDEIMIRKVRFRHRSLEERAVLRSLRRFDTNLLSEKILHPQYFRFYRGSIHWQDNIDPCICS